MKINVLFRKPWYYVPGFFDYICYMIYEPRNRVEVETPKGPGIIWLVTDYGHETDTIYTVILNASGEMWQFTHKDIRVKNNITFGRNIK